jgi:hypothetical protein
VDQLAAFSGWIDSTGCPYKPSAAIGEFAHSRNQFEIILNPLSVLLSFDPCGL